MEWERAIWGRPWRLKGPILALAVLVVALLVVAFVAVVTERGDGDVTTVAEMAGASMEPTFNDGQIVRVLEYGNTTPGRGDVVVFAAPTASTETDGAAGLIVKRVIGVPGDEVSIDPDRGAVTVNGEVIDEPYIEGGTLCVRPCGPWAVPEEAYFVMGDNRPISNDSRQGWFVPIENIVGRVEE